MGAVGGGLGGAAGAGGAAGSTAGGTAGATTGGVGAGTAVTPTATALAGSGAGAGATTGSIYGGAGSGINAATNIGAGVSGAGTGGGFGLTAGSGTGATFGSLSAPTAGSTFGSLAAPTTAGAAGGAGAGGASSLGIAQGSALPAGYGASAPPATNIFGQTLGQPGVLTNTQLGMTGATTGLAGAMQAERDQYGQPTDDYEGGSLQKLKYDPDKFSASNPTYAPASVYRPTYAAEGGIMKLAQGGVARFDGGGLGSLAMGMPSGAGTGAGAQTMADQGIAALGQAGKKRMLTKEQMDAIALQGMTKAGLQDVYGQMAEQGLAAGGHLGGYSDGGRMLKGPGDGMSDNIPASIAGKQPARLADGEFVVPADVVSHLGNGSTDAGAKQLYAMMNRVRKARTGNPKQGKQIKPAKYMAA
jgi:hypothetical protein